VKLPAELDRDALRVDPIDELGRSEGLTAAASGGKYHGKHHWERPKLSNPPSPCHYRAGCHTPQR
jgi:hypothetical protein